MNTIVGNVFVSVNAISIFSTFIYGLWIVICENNNLFRPKFQCYKIIKLNIIKRNKT